MKKIILLISALAISGLLLAQQLPNYIPTNNLLMWVPFDNSYTDVSANPNNITNSGVTLMADRNGVPNSAGAFNGNGAFMEAATPTFTFSQTDTFSYSIWVKKALHTSAGANADIALMTASNTTGVFITLLQFGNSSTGVNFGVNKQQSSWTWASTTYNLSQWDNYIAVYEGGAMKLFLNGNQVATNTFTNTGSTASNIPFKIGKGLGSITFYGGLDDIAVWGRALNTQEINDVFTGVFTGVKPVNESSSLKVYPNPAASFLTTTNNSSYTIKNILGADVAFGKTNINGLIPIEDLNPSVYFIQFENEKNAIKFVKN